MYYLLYFINLPPDVSTMEKKHVNKTSTFFKLSNIKYASNLCKQYFLFQWKITMNKKNICKKN